MSEQQPARNIYQFVENAVDDLGQLLALGAGGTLAGLYFGGRWVAGLLRPVFGQSAGTITTAGGIVLGVVFIGTVSYFVVNRNGKITFENAKSFLGKFGKKEQSETDTTAPTVDAAETHRSLFQMQRLLSAPHLLIVTGTRAGKTTFGNALMKMAMKNGADVVVLDGKPEGDWAKKWEGVNVKLRLAKDFPMALTHVHRVMEGRKQLTNERPKPLYVMIDETQNVTGRIPETVETISALLSEGAAFSIHVILMTQAATIAQIGFAGRIPVLQSNTTPVYLGVDKSTGQRYFVRGTFNGGLVKPDDVATRYSTPVLPSPWGITDDMPIHDDSHLLNEINVVAEMPTVATQRVAPVQSGGVNHTTQEVNTPYQHAPVQNGATVLAPTYHAETVTTEVENLVQSAKHVINRLTGQNTKYLRGQTPLTEGEVVAIKMLNTAVSQNELCKIVFGSKNQPIVNAIKDVLSDVEKIF